MSDNNADSAGIARSASRMRCARWNRGAPLESGEVPLDESIDLYG
jgi:hypothetical protein